MLFPKLPIRLWFLCVAFLLNILPPSVASAEHGIVTVALEWGSSVHTYMYVFSGLVTCQNHPCANVHVDLVLETENQGALTQTALTGNDGRYLMQVTLQGSPQEASSWKLTAQTSSMSDQESAEAEGRVILSEDQTTVMVDRTLPLIQA